MNKENLYNELKIVICKECGDIIENSLCSYGCKYDNEWETNRSKESKEIHIYKFDRIEECK